MPMVYIKDDEKHAWINTDKIISVTASRRGIEFNLDIDNGADITFCFGSLRKRREALRLLGLTIPGYENEEG